jgi:hypothetical protein
MYSLKYPPRRSDIIVKEPIKLRKIAGFDEFDIMSYIQKNRRSVKSAKEPSTDSSRDNQ